MRLTVKTIEEQLMFLNKEKMDKVTEAVVSKSQSYAETFRKQLNGSFTLHRFSSKTKLLFDKTSL